MRDLSLLNTPKETAIPPKLPENALETDQEYQSRLQFIFSINICSKIRGLDKNIKA
jgi:hypothetical protein